MGYPTGFLMDCLKDLMMEKQTVNLMDWRMAKPTVMLKEYLPMAMLKVSLPTVTLTDYADPTDLQMEIHSVILTDLLTVKKMAYLRTVRPKDLPRVIQKGYRKA